MHTMRVLLLVPLLLLSACGNRHPAQQTAQSGAQPQTGQAAQPAPAQPAPPPAAGPAPVQSAPAVAQQAPSTASQPAPPPPAGPSRQAALPQPAPPPAYSQPAPSAIRIPSGTVWRVRLDETLDTRRNRPGDRFSATLIRPIRVNGAVVVPRGAYCSGHLVESKPSGRFRGRAPLSLTLDSFDLDGRRYHIRASHVMRESGGHKKRNLILIGGGSGLGTALGAIAGGPAGALIGAGVGGAAGTAGAAITGKKNVRLPVESAVAFSLRAPVWVNN
jgi:hypothetical protein